MPTPPCWAQAHSVGRTKQATHSRPAHTGPGTPIPLAGQTTHHKWPALSCFMPTGEEHADECTLWLLGIKRERTSAQPPSSRAREEAVEASDSFFQKEETGGEGAWAAFSRRKKREEKVLGLLHQKAWTTPPKRIERDGGLRLRDFSKEAEASKRRTQRLLPSLPRRFDQTSASGKAGRCTGHRSALHRPTQGAA